MGFLNNDGVIYLWAKVKALFNKGVTDISINGKTVTITKGDEAQARKSQKIRNIVYLGEQQIRLMEATVLYQLQKAENKTVSLKVMALGEHRKTQSTML